jgi:serine/threonine protein kinase
MAAAYRLHIPQDVGNHFQAGDQIGPYRITTATANGYHAVHARESHAVVLEVWPEGATDIGAKIAAAAHALGAVNHPGIAPIVDYGMSNGHPWMASERVAGMVVHDLLVGRGLRADKVSELLRGVVDVLRFAHAHGVVHGRLRAHSIVLTEQDSVSISGWGIHLVGAHRERSVYDAPEARASAKADVYALGVIAFRALTGQFPRGCLTTHVPGAPPALAKLIAEMTAPDPARRPTAADVREAIAEMLGEVSPELVEEILLDEIDDADFERELASAPRFAKPRWTPPTHFLTSTPTLDDDFESEKPGTGPG